MLLFATISFSPSSFCSSFGHLDGLNSTVRTGSQTFTVSDAHIRFERNTEAKGKTGELVEKVMREKFAKIAPVCLC